MVAKGITQGAPLSPVLFLIFMAPILEEMEHCIQEEVGGVTVHCDSTGDGFHNFAFFT